MFYVLNMTSSKTKASRQHISDLFDTSVTTSFGSSVAGFAHSSFQILRLQLGYPEQNNPLQTCTILTIGYLW